MSEPRIAALIPCLDVEGTLGAVIQGVLAHVDHALVVDDGSTDSTSAAGASAGADVLRHEKNLGKGAALRSGMERLRDQGYTHVFSVDGDGQHLTDEMPVLLEEWREAPDAIVVGERIREEGQEVAGIRRFGNDFANWWVALAAGTRFPDTQSGFRIYPIAPTLGLGVRADHYEFESEVLILAARRGLDVRSRKVHVYYPPPDRLVSHYNPWIDTIRIIKTVVPFAAGWRG
ncbi:MAG: glycosyltransferase family 2 protein [Candidatus Binatia bacterium]|nr:glycosyltransferase family 2 protein [Candidatus Binatia bacterium]